MMIKLLIKGTPSEARVAADLHGINLASAYRYAHTPDYVETIAGASPNHRDAVIRWFCEGPPFTPFPTGTLLWYGDTQ
jgi:hypothetical protein